MDTTALSAAYDDLLETARTVSAADYERTPPPGEWNADQILAHLVLLNAATISAACSVTSGAVATYDNRLAQDTWTIDRTMSLAGGSDGMRSQIRRQADALCAIVSTLSDTELATPIPTLLISNDALLVDDRVPLAVLIDGLAGNELPGHADQLRTLLPADHVMLSSPGL